MYARRVRTAAFGSTELLRRRPARWSWAPILTYLLAVAVIEWLRQVSAWPRIADLASSPAEVAAGQLWTLLTSGLVVAGDPVAQLVATAIVVVLLVRRGGARAFWVAAGLGHVGATLMAYAGVGVVWLVAEPDVDAVVRAPDFGISCVWAGALGALVAGGGRSGHEPLHMLAAALCVAAFVVAIPFSSDLAGIEHALAFLLGAGWSLRAARSASPVVSRA